jgi:hypothetical protein
MYKSAVAVCFPKIDEDDNGAEELKRLNSEIAGIESLFDNTESINVKGCWSFAKFVLNNTDKI